MYIFTLLLLDSKVDQRRLLVPCIGLYIVAALDEAVL